jgi:hypothetical protein
MMRTPCCQQEILKIFNIHGEIRNSAVVLSTDEQHLEPHLQGDGLLWLFKVKDLLWVIDKDGIFLVVDGHSCASRGG